MSKNKPKNSEIPSNMDRLMRGLTAVTKEELDREIAKEQRKRAAGEKAKKPKRQK